MDGRWFCQTGKIIFNENKLGEMMGLGSIFARLMEFSRGLG